MQVRTIDSREKLNKFLSTQVFSSLSQSWEWGEFQKAAGYQVFRLAVEDDEGAVLAAATIIKKRLPLGKSYFFCPRGPVVSAGAEKLQISNSKYQINSNAEDLNEDIKITLDYLFEEIVKMAKRENAIFLRFEPLFQILNSKYQISKTLDIEPSKTSVLDLQKSEDELLAGMHQKTRYNIRLAEKKGVTVREVGLEKFDEFWSLMVDTKDRDGFRLHSREHYIQMLKTMPPYSNKKDSSAAIRLFIAYYNEVPAAALLAGFFGDTATYLHGGSANEYRNLMAPYALQWHMIKTAKHEGYNFYDFFGIDQGKWPGVTRFKIGFGGFQLELPGTFDLNFSQAWYYLYKIVRMINRIR